MVGYYLGTQLTRTELDELRRNPQGRMLGFILDFQGLIVDGYDHLRERYHSMPVLMNDFCDDHGNNTEAVIETITINSKRIDVIAIYANRDVVAHEEFGYAYGHTGLCDASLPLPVLFKAARYYHNQIMKDEKRIWWELPQARYLFNTPYHCVGPLTQEDIICRITKHFTSCVTCCSCGIEDFLSRIRTRLSDENIGRKVLSNGEARITKVLKSAPATRRHQSFTKPLILKEDASTTLTSVHSIPQQPPSQRVLSFPPETSSWRSMDELCDDLAGKHHLITNPTPACISITTETIQDLRANCLTGDVIYAYLTTLCTHVTTIKCAVLDPLVAPIIVGADRQSKISPHPYFLDSHRQCDLLLCPVIYSNHISLIIVDYLTAGLHHLNAMVGCHDSEQYFAGIKKFFKNHIQWRRKHKKPLSLHIPSKWNHFIATVDSCPQQTDVISCGVYACAMITCRVLGIPLRSFTDQHVARMRLHIYHCIMTNTFPKLLLDFVTSENQEIMLPVNEWYTMHKNAYKDLRALRQSIQLTNIPPPAQAGTRADPILNK